MSKHIKKNTKQRRTRDGLGKSNLLLKFWCMCHTEEIYVNSLHQAYTIQGILTVLKSMANVLTNLRAQHANLHKEHLMLSAILFFKNKVLFVTGSWQRTEHRSDSLFSSSVLRSIL